MAVCSARSPEFISEPSGRIVGGWRRRHVNDGPFFERVVIFRRYFWVFARAKTTVTDLVWLAGEASVSEWDLSAGYADESAIGEGRE